MARIVHIKAIPVVTVVAKIIITRVDATSQGPRSGSADPIKTSVAILAPKALHTASMATSPKAILADKFPLLEWPAVLVLIDRELSIAHPHKLSPGGVIIKPPNHGLLVRLDAPRVKIAPVVEGPRNVALLAYNTDPRFEVQKTPVLLYSRWRTPRNTQTVMPAALAVQIRPLLDPPLNQAQGNLLLFLLLFPLILLKRARVAALRAFYDRGEGMLWQQGRNHSQDRQ